MIVFLLIEFLFKVGVVFAICFALITAANMLP